MQGKHKLESNYAGFGYLPDSQETTHLNKIT